MLAHLSDELRDGVPVSFASRIVELVEIAPGLGRVRSRLLMDKTKGCQRLDEVVERRMGILEGSQPLCSKGRHEKKRRAQERGGGIATEWAKGMNSRLRVDCAHRTESLKEAIGS